MAPPRVRRRGTGGAKWAGRMCVGVLYQTGTGTVRYAYCYIALHEQRLLRERWR